MIGFRRLVGWIAGAVAAGSLAAGPAVAQVEAVPALRGAAVSERQVLVMLPLAPPHYRPGASYSGSYDVRYGSRERRSTAEALAKRHGLAVVGEWPMPSIGVDCFVLEPHTGALPADVAAQLAADPRVESAQPVQRFETLGHDDPLFPLQPAAERWQLAALHTVTTGRGVRIAEIDSGVDRGHPDLSGQIELAENFVDDRPYVGELHGTAVAGIMAARADDGVGIAGIAPGARLLALRACWQESPSARLAACSSFTLAKALQFAIQRRPQVINLSLGGPPDRLLARLLDAALDAGIVVVAADDPRHPQALPAAHPGVIRVAAESDPVSGDSALRAPGRDVPAPIPGAKWNFVTGSSFAAAHVAGVVALLAELDQEIGPMRIQFLLRGMPAARNDLYVDACGAVAQVAHRSVCIALREARRAPGL